MSASAATPRSYFTVVALAAAMVVFAGFAPTYYLKAWFGTPPLPTLVHVHGLVMSAWFLLFVVQARLVAAHRVDLHRRLGIAAAALAVAVVVLGCLTAVTAVRLGHTPGPPPLAFLAVPLGDMLVFTLLVSAALYWRRRPDVHKRLMLLAFVGMLSAAFGRLHLPGGILTAFGLTLGAVLACLVVDTLREGRLHRAFAAGAALVAVSWPLRLWLSGTTAWQRFAGWLVA